MKSKSPYGIKRSDFKRFNFEELQRIFDCWHNYYMPDGLFKQMNADEIMALLYGGIPLKEDRETIRGLIEKQNSLEASVEAEVNAKSAIPEDVKAGYASLCYEIINSVNKFGYKSPVVNGMKKGEGKFPRARGALEARVVGYFIKHPEEAQDFVNHALWPREYSDKEVKEGRGMGLLRQKAFHDPNIDGRSRTLYLSGPDGIYTKLSEMAKANQ